MSCDEVIAQCGTWITSPAQSHDLLHHTTASPRSISIMDGSSDLSADPSASSAYEHNNANGVFDPSSPASTTAVSGVNVSTYSLETQLSDASADLSVDHGSATSDDIGSAPLFTQANTYASDHQGLTSIAFTGPPLTTANLTAHEQRTSGRSSSHSSVALWLASGTDERRTGAADWSQLVASDPLAVAIETAVAVEATDGERYTTS